MTPQLRFPDFTDEWQVKKLGDIFEFKRTNSLSRAQLSEDGKVGNIHYGDIHRSLPTLLDASKVKLPMIVSSKQFNIADAIKIGDVILADASEDYADIGKAIEVVNLNHGQEIYSGLHTFLMRPAYPSAHGFNGMLFKTATIRKQLMRIATGISVLGVSKNNVSQLVVATPSKPEQEKIADFLTAVDERISVGEKKLELLETYKRGVMQKIFSQQIRFKDENGSSYPDWEQKKLGEILKEVNEKTEKSNKFETLSSTTKGLFSQKDYFSKNIASDDNTGYKVLRINQIVLSPQNLWMGNINFNDKFEAGIVSPSYKIFETVRAVSGYLRHILKTRRMLYEYTQASEQGASIVRRNLDISSFMAISVTIPTVQEQQKIADFLTTLDEKITAEKSKLTAAREFKKALLQRMFV